MTKLKKLLAVIIVVAFMATFGLPALAAEMTDAEKCETIGILQGSGSGVDADYLAADTTRLQAAILTLRFLGKEAEALVFEGTDSFTDDAVVAWAQGRNLLGYLKANGELGWLGYPDGSFKPTGIASAQMLYKVLLVALGYEEGVDFTWASVLTVAASKGLLAVADMDIMTNNDTAIAIVEALNAATKADADITLVQKLVDDGIIDANDAVAAGFEITPSIVSAAQTASNKITVTFSTAVDTAAAVIKIKQGVVIWYSTVAWNTTKDVATLTTVSALPAGTYVVEVTGIGDTMTDNVVVTTAVASEVVISTAIIYENSTTITYAVNDQFGVAMTTAAAIGTAYNQTDAAVVVLTPAATTMTFAAQTKADVITFSLIYNGLTVSKTFSVQANIAPSTIGFGTVMPLATKAYIFAGDAGLVVPYALYDQYGAAKLLPVYVDGAADDVATIDGILFVSSGPAIVDPDTFAVSAAGVLTFTAGTAGTATVMAYLHAVLIGQFSVTVSAVSAPATAVITAPSVLISAGQAVSLDLLLKDQYNTTLDNSTNAGLLTITPVNCAAAINATTDKLDITATVAGTATVNILVGTTLIGTISFTVYPAAAASSITGVTTPKIFENAAVDALAIADVAVLDQYGRAFTPGAIVLSEVTDASNAITVAANTITADAANVGTATVRVTVGALTFDYTVSVVASAGVVSYVMNPLGTIYASATPAYFATPVLVGLDASGNTVVLATVGYDLVTSSNLAVAVGNALKVQGVAAGTSTIKVYKAGVERASGTITVTAEALVATTVTVATAALTTATIASTVTVIDQFGVAIAAPAGTYYVNGVATLGTATFGTAGTKVVKFIATNGANGTASVVVTAP